MIHFTCRLTAKNRDQLRNPTLGNRVGLWASVTFYKSLTQCKVPVYVYFMLFARPQIISFSSSCTPLSPHNAARVRFIIVEIYYYYKWLASPVSHAAVGQYIPGLSAQYCDRTLAYSEFTQPDATRHFCCVVSGRVNSALVSVSAGSMLEPGGAQTPPNLAVLMTHCGQLLRRKTRKFDASESDLRV